MATHPHPSTPAISRLKRRGFTLTELAIVMGIIGTIIAALWTGYSMVLENQHVTRATQQILEIAANVREIMAMRPVFKPSGSTNYTTIFNEAHAFPSDMTYSSDVNGPYMTNPWNSRAIVFNFNPGFSFQTFRISYYGIPASACTKIAAAIITQSGTPNADPAEITTDYGGYPLNLTTTAVDGTSLAALCAHNTNSETYTNSVEFDFRVSR